MIGLYMRADHLIFYNDKASYNLRVQTTKYNLLTI